MLTLYYKPSCAFSRSVIGEAEALGIQMQLKDVRMHPEYKEELAALGGKTQTPFLFDSERGEKLYESNEINNYLSEQYGGKKRDSFGGLRIHQSEEVCDTCQ